MTISARSCLEIVDCFGHASLDLWLAIGRPVQALPTSSSMIDIAASDEESRKIRVDVMPQARIIIPREFETLRHQPAYIHSICNC
jgi:hypothetical protein